MRFAGINKTSTVDYPGVLSAVVFTPGCNFNCFYCHNRQIANDKRVATLQNAEVMAFLKKRAGLLDGVVISGGEPTLQHGLVGFASYVKSLGYRVKLDTNGSQPDVVARLLQEGLVDYIALDYKAPFFRYQELCGQQPQAVQQTAGLLRQSNIQWEMRTTLVPQISEEDLWEMAIALPVFPAYALQLYRPQPGDTRYLKTLHPYTTGQISSMAESIRAYQPNTFVRA